MGAMSEPCCISDPIVNQNAFERLNWFSKYSGSSIHGYGLVHSYGLILAMMNSKTDTPQYAVITQSQTNALNGAKNENKLGELFVDFLYNMLIPVSETD